MSLLERLTKFQCEYLRDTSIPRELQRQLGEIISMLRQRERSGPGERFGLGEQRERLIIILIAIENDDTPGLHPKKGKTLELAEEIKSITLE